MSISKHIRASYCVPFGSSAVTNAVQRKDGDISCAVNTWHPIASLVVDGCMQDAVVVSSIIGQLPCPCSRMQWRNKEIDKICNMVHGDLLLH